MTEPRLKFANEISVKDGVITAVLSTEAVDRDGDIVRAAGWKLDNFTRAPRLMSCHDYTSLTKQIGEWRNVHVDPQRKALVGEPHYYTGQGNPEADWAYYLASIGQATYSVGFNPESWEPRKDARGDVFTAQELLECSHVPIPSNAEALQLMAKAFQSRQRTGTSTSQRQAGRVVHKWDSNYMGDDDGGYGYGPVDVHCIVPGCDDACQMSVPVCASHLKGLLNLEPEPPEDKLEEALEGQMMAFGRTVQRLHKAGKVLSGANLGKLHGAMQALGAVHDGACDGEDCPLAPAERDKGRKAAGEGSGSAGGFTVSDGGTHGAFDGKHSHSHDAAGHSSSADDAGNHDHSHTHSGDGNHGHSHEGVNFKTAREREEHEALHKAQSSTAEQNDLPDDCFAVVSAGGTKEDGKTTPRSLRHLPHHKADGSIDLPHLKNYKNALSRLPQTDLSAEDKAKAEKHLDAHAKAEKIGEYAEKGATNGLDPHALSQPMQDALTKALEAVEW